MTAAHHNLNFHSQAAFFSLQEQNVGVGKKTLASLGEQAWRLYPLQCQHAWKVADREEGVDPITGAPINISDVTAYLLVGSTQGEVPVGLAFAEKEADEREKWAIGYSFPEE